MSGSWEIRNKMRQPKPSKITILRIQAVKGIKYSKKEKSKDIKQNLTVS